MGRDTAIAGRAPGRTAWRGRTVLVTGAAGFIGSHVCDALAGRGARVVAVDNLKSGRWENLDAAHPPARKVRLDVRDAAGVAGLVARERPAMVFHLAANASVPGSVEDPVYDFQTNVDGTFAVLDAVRRHAPSARCVFASSGAVYGEPGKRPVAETAPLRPISPYGCHKLAAEAVSRSFHAVFRLPVVVARIFNTYGPRMPRFVVLDFLRKLERDPSRLEVLGDGRQVRDLTYVADTVRALLLLARRGEAGQAYNVASGRSLSVTDLARRLVALRGLQGRTQLAFTGRSWTGDAQHWRVDVGRLRDLGRFAVTPIDAGLKRVIAWYDATGGPLDPRGARRGRRRTAETGSGR